MAPTRRQRGFTYLSLMILVAIIGLATAASLKFGSVIQRSRAEQELLDIGAAFSDALKSYADATPQGMPTQPPSLKELLKDPRTPALRRHLRKIFVDPMTGKAEWGIVYLGDKTGVLAVYSLSDAKPVKVGNFPPRFAGFEGKNRISDWKFVMAQEGPGTPPAAAPATSTSPTVPEKQQPIPAAAPEAAAPVAAPENPVEAAPLPSAPEENKADPPAADEQETTQK